MLTVFSLLFRWSSGEILLAEVTLFLWSMAAFSLVPALQINVVRYGHDAPHLVSTLNISAFNLGNALGAWLGGVVIGHSAGLRGVPVAAALLALAGLLTTLMIFRGGSRAAGQQGHP